MTHDLLLISVCRHGSHSSLQTIPTCLPFKAPYQHRIIVLCLLITPLESAKCNTVASRLWTSAHLIDQSSFLPLRAAEVCGEGPRGKIPGQSLHTREPQPDRHGRADPRFAVVASRAGGLVESPVGIDGLPVAVAPVIVPVVR